MSTVSPDDDTSVRVCVRVRPFISTERVQSCTSVVTYPLSNQILLTNSHAFTYDYLFKEESKQAEVYADCVAPLVASFFEGYNATILAYGQTGSGKTHTMGTATHATVPSHEFGIIPRVISELFDMIKKENKKTFILTASFLEIHNDDINDLLCPLDKFHPDRPIPSIREGKGDKIEVKDIVEEDVTSYEQTMNILEKGSLNRATGSTKMNDVSSRSHAIFTLKLSQKQNEGDDPNDPMSTCNDEFIVSKFHFVDLAGSERLKRTGAVGERMKEGININQGLLALGNVISALGDPARKATHVPFRDSKITRLLQDSLGGNSKTLMIACVSPADINREETLNTLQYANRARNIKNKPIINRDPNSIKMDLLRTRIKELEMENMILKGGGSASTSNLHLPSLMQNFQGLMVQEGHISVNLVEYDRLVQDKEIYELEVKRMDDKCKELRSEISNMMDAKIQAEIQRDSYRSKMEQLIQKYPVILDSLKQEQEAAKQDGATDEKTESGNDSLIDSLLGTDGKTTNVLQEKLQIIQKLMKKLQQKDKQLQEKDSTIARLQSEPYSGRRTKRRDDDGTDELLSEEEDNENDEGTEVEEDEAADEEAGSVHASDISDAEADDDEQIEREKTIAALRTREYEQSMKLLKNESEVMEHEIQSKQAIVLQLTQEKQRAIMQRGLYESRIQLLERENQAILEEQARKIAEFEAHSRANGQAGGSVVYTEEQREKLKSLETQLTKVRKELKSYQDKIKDLERYKRQHDADEIKLKQLGKEIDVAKKTRVALAKKMEENQNKYREFCEVQENKMKLMMKEGRKRELELKKMKDDQEKQNLQLKRREEKINMLAKKVKEQELKAANYQSMKLASQKSKKSSSASSKSTKPAGRAIRRKGDRDASSTAAARSKSTSNSIVDTFSGTSKQDEEIQRTIREEVSVLANRSYREDKLRHLHSQYRSFLNEKEVVDQQMNAFEFQEGTESLWRELEEKQSGLTLSVESTSQQIQELQNELAQTPDISSSDVASSLIQRLKLSNLDTTKRALWLTLLQLVDVETQRRKYESQIRTDTADTIYASAPINNFSPISAFRRASSQPTAAPQLISPPRVRSRRNVQLSSLSVHLAQTTGIEPGVEELEHMHVARADGDESEDVAAGQSSLGTSYIDNEDDDNADYDSIKSRSSVGKAAVFDRLTNPSSYTGVSKSKFTFKDNSTDASRVGGMPLSAPPRKAPLKTTVTPAPNNLTRVDKRASVPSSGNSTFVTTSSSKIADRAPSPVWAEPASSPTSHPLTSPLNSLSSSALPPPSLRLPIYERLHDPKSYTGAQKMKFSEGVQKKSSLSGSNTERSREREREEGFDLSLSSRPARSKNTSPVRHQSTGSSASVNNSPSAKHTYDELNIDESAHHHSNSTSDERDDMSPNSPMFHQAPQEHVRAKHPSMNRLNSRILPSSDGGSSSFASSSSTSTSTSSPPSHPHIDTSQTDVDSLEAHDATMVVGTTTSENKENVFNTPDWIPGSISNTQNNELTQLGNNTYSTRSKTKNNNPAYNITTPTSAKETWNAFEQVFTGKNK